MTKLDDSLRDAEAQVDAMRKLGNVMHTDHSGGRMTWHCFGDGPPLVLVHGGVGSWLHWIGNIPELSKTWRLLLPDLPGLGDSDPIVDPVTPEALGTALADGVRSLTSRSDPIRLAAFSFGGIAATHAAVQLASSAHTLVLVGASGTGLPRKPMQLIRRTPEMTQEQRFECHDQNLRLLMLSDDYPVDALARYIHDINDRNARLKSRKISMTDSLAKALSNVEAKVAGIWGSKDITAAPWLNERRDLLRSVQPTAPFHLIDAGHWVQYEAVAEFNECLLTTLRELS